MNVCFKSHDMFLFIVYERKFWPAGDARGKAGGYPEMFNCIKYAQQV